MKHYHYIFTGSGLAALMTAYKMAVSGRFAEKHILLIDPDTKAKNDRTWCFWQKGESFWESIISKKWDTAVFADIDTRIDLDFKGYRYNMVRGIDFYTFVFKELKKHQNFEIIHDKVTKFKDSGSGVVITTTGGSYSCDKLLNSIYNNTLPARSNYPLLQQHFIGWHVKTDRPVFNQNKPVFMDFSIAQSNNTRFMYVLPLSSTEAIVEYTLFSKDLLPEQEYEDAIREYLTPHAYQIIDKERGSIPMTVYPFWKSNTRNILNIGSAGGWTKASTGYTFRNADKKSGELVKALIESPDFTTFHKSNKFRFYDKLLLDILYRKNHKGREIFSSLFRDGDASLVFKFLDEETNLREDLQVILKCPKPMFIEAFVKNIF